jgi:hypothetical protein
MQEEKIFRIARLSAENDNVTIAIGNYRVTNKVFKTENEAQKYINSRPWELIAALASLYVEFALKKDATNESENTNNESKED